MRYKYVSKTLDIDIDPVNKFLLVKSMYRNDIRIFKPL